MSDRDWAHEFEGLVRASARLDVLNAAIDTAEKLVTEIAQEQSDAAAYSGAARAFSEITNLLEPRRCAAGAQRLRASETGSRYQGSCETPILSALEVQVLAALDPDRLQTAGEIAAQLDTTVNVAWSVLGRLLHGQLASLNSAIPTGFVRTAWGDRAREHFTPLEQVLAEDDDHSPAMLDEVEVRVLQALSPASNGVYRSASQVAASQDDGGEESEMIRTQLFSLQERGLVVDDGEKPPAYARTPAGQLALEHHPLC